MTEFSRELSVEQARRPAHEFFTVALEPAGRDRVERVFRFIGGVLTAAFSGPGAGSEVIGDAVVIRDRETEKPLLSLDIVDTGGDQELLEVVNEDLEAFTAGEFADQWLHADHEGRHIQRRH
ncbi:MULTISPECIES: hypothetical protein [Auritidibacter]|uniref:hypothetical protein n=1 Tax=Auritidibacter TaxID=1160973 RepID=UPI000D72D373|nr:MULTISPECIES: hypothetical protein [Auritidibacter]NIH71399.1 hypothetical protein [Auritidibacter ignavus]PXA78205.1 hypothetical protein DCC24_00450 [Auritidibacter sp. NML100628]PXA80968.1 hypothetical protein DCC25_03695 [Auritidibacter sp. NML120636]RMX22458.1 hypothetical protein DYI20_09675 [Auritidibacter ignavus]WGH86127.1 hypothetical protein QDX24_11350 [Auritidibacter ignavus]